MPSGLLSYYYKMVLVLVQFFIVVKSNQFTQLLANRQIVIMIVLGVLP